MNAIIFDLELVKRFKKGQLSEIVEIGACKVDINSKKITDQFQIYISPKSGYIAKSTRKFINMKKEDIKHAVPFTQGIEEFKNWVGKDYYLCSWGRDDRVHIINQCVRNKLDLDWFQNYNDIQKKIGAILREDNKNQLGLMDALEIAGIEAKGQAHSGIDDAINTADLFIKYVDQLTLDQNFVTKEEIAKQRRTFKRTKIYQKKEVSSTNQK